MTRQGISFFSQVQRALRDRGVHITLAHLTKGRTNGDVLDVEDWAVSGMPFSVAPEWLRDLVAKGRTNVHLIGGICRECGCTDDDACDGGCAWVDHDHTLCSSCAPGRSVRAGHMTAAVPGGRRRLPIAKPDYYGTRVDGPRRSVTIWHIVSRRFKGHTVCGLRAGGAGWYGDFSAPPKGARTCKNCDRMRDAETA